MAMSMRYMCDALRKTFRGLSSKNVVPRYGVSAFSTTNTDATGQQPPNVNQKTENEAQEKKEINYDELIEEKNKLSDKVIELEDKYKRALAETESVRQRFRKEVEEAKIFGIRSFCKDLLPVADVLTKVNSLFTDEAEKKSDDGVLLNTMQEGVKGIEAQLQQVFGRHGLVRVDPVKGEKFDPKIHQSLFVVSLPKTEELSGEPVPESGSIMTVTKCGYKLRDETIRPACVGIYE